MNIEGYVVDTIHDAHGSEFRALITIDPFNDNNPRDWDNVFSMCLKSRNYTLVEEDVDYWVDVANERITERVNELLDNADREEPGWPTLEYWARHAKEFASLLDGRWERRATFSEVEDAFGGRILPVYAYIHGNIGLSTSRTSYPFNCPWDSGQLGYALVSDDMIHREFGQYYPDGRWTRPVIAPDGETIIEDMGDVNDWLYATLKGELAVLEDYWNGNVYCISVVADDNDETLDSTCGFYGSDEDYMRWSAQEMIDEVRTLHEKDLAAAENTRRDQQRAMDLFDAADLFALAVPA